METAEIIDPGFSVADGEDVRLTKGDQGLILQFRNWQEEQIQALFVDAVSYRWDQIDWDLLEGERFDSTHVIANSEWLREHVAQRSIEENEGYVHYRLNFNACGTLQVLAKSIMNQTAEQGRGANALPRVAHD